VVVLPRETFLYDNHIFKTSRLGGTGLVCRTDGRLVIRSIYKWRAVQKNLHCSLRNSFCCSWCYLHLTSLGGLTPRVISVAFRIQFVVMVTTIMYEGYVGIVVTVSVLFLYKKKWGKKLPWTRTYACNSKIKNYTGVVSPKGTFLSLYHFFSHSNTFVEWIVPLLAT
jgi:hypothetical protein